MGMAVRALVLVHVDGANGEVVVQILAVARRQLLEEGRDVLHEEGLVLVEHHGRRGMAGEHNQAQDHAGLFHELGDAVGDVQEPGSVLRRHAHGAGRAEDAQPIEADGEALPIGYCWRRHIHPLAPAAVPIRRKTLRNRSESTIQRSPS